MTNLINWIRQGFVRSVIVFFIFGLVFSHAFEKQAVQDVFVDFLADNEGYDLWKSIMLVNILDGLSSVLKPLVILVLEPCIGRFLSIIICTIAHTAGLGLLRFCPSNAVAWIPLIALGTARETTLRDFFCYQLSEEVKKEHTEKKDGEDKESSSEEKGKNDSGTRNHWWYAATIIGSLVAVTCLGSASWSTTLEVSFIMMGATGLWFILGVFSYHPDEKPSESHLITTVFRVFKNKNEDQVPTDEQGRVVERLYSMKPLVFTFIGYSLVSVAGYTYFILQTGYLDSHVGSLDVPIMVFFVLRSSVAFVVQTIQSKYKVVRPHWSLAFGLFCAALCCFVASPVEIYRLSQIRKHKSLNMMILTPQYFLLGLMEGFVEGGLETLLSDRVSSESRKRIVYPCIEMLLGIGKFSSILVAFMFRTWISNDINDSHLDWYFLVLASLSLVCFGIYVFYANFKLQKSLVDAETSDTTV